MASGASRGSVVLRKRLMRDSNRRRHRSSCIEMLPFDDEYHEKANACIVLMCAIVYAKVVSRYNVALNVSQGGEYRNGNAF